MAVDLAVYISPGKPFRVPPSLKLANQDKKKRKRKAVVKVEPAGLIPIEEFITQACE